MTADTGGDGRPPRPVFYNDPRIRAIAFQTVVVAGVAAFIYFIIGNTTENLRRVGIASGFGFLDRTAGFDVSVSLIEYSRSSTYGRALVVGLLNTLVVSAIGIVFATLFGFLIGIARLSRNWLVARLAQIYVELIRNIPLLLQILFWYFAVLTALPGPRQAVVWADAVFLSNRGLYMPKPLFGAGSWLILAASIVAVAAVVVLARWARARQLRTGRTFPVLVASLGLLIIFPLGAAGAVGFPITWSVPALAGFNFAGGMVVQPEFAALLFALVIYTASFIAEIVRAGILAVSHGQTEAAQALGLSRARTLQLIVVPQALRVIIPPLTSQFLNLTKNSSLAAAVGYPDLVSVFAGTVLNQTGQAVEVIGITMLIYMTMSLLISLFMNWYNRRVALKER